MSTNFFIRAIALISSCALIASGASSCKKNDEEQKQPKVRITGTVSDKQGNPLEKVTVKVMASSSETAASSTTDAQGKFNLEAPLSKAKSVVFEKEGYSTVSETITSGKIKDGVVELHPELEFAAARITGRVLDGSKGNAPFSGAIVNIGSQKKITGADGVFTFEGLTISDYTVSVAASGYDAVERNVKPEDFKENGTVNLGDIVLGGAEILPGKTIADLRNASCWYINEYRAGFGLGHGGDDPEDAKWGNATMSLMSGQFPHWEGRSEMQNEGCTIRIVNGYNDDAGPADMQKFNSYTYGKKLITADNAIMSVNWRTHNGEHDVFWSVGVVDLTSASPELEMVPDKEGKKVVSGKGGEWRDSYLDLSKYAGKEVVIAIGLYKSLDNACDFLQLVLTHISFGDSQVVQRKSLGLYGTPVASLGGWRMSTSMLKSTMVNEHTSFNGKKGALVWEPDPCFGVWRNTGHIASEWGLQYVQNTCTPDCGEGFMLQTGGEAAADFAKPVSYFYSKFKIDDAHDRMLFYTRNFSSENYTYFKLAIVKENGEVTFADPVSNTATKAEKASDGCWKFIHENGWSEELGNTAKFVYDLSSFKGQNVMICIALFRNSGPEQKLVVCGVDFE